MAYLRLPSDPRERAPFVARALHAIAAADPGFDVDALMRQVPALYEHSRRGDTSLATVSVADQRLVWAEHAPGEDRLVVGIDCIRDTGTAITSPTEYWTLARPTGTRTASDPAGACPECAAPTEEDAAFCRYCGTALGPLRGWVVRQRDETVDWYDGPYTP